MNRIVPVVLTSLFLTFPLLAQRGGHGGGGMRGGGFSGARVSGFARSSAPSGVRFGGGSGGFRGGFSNRPGFRSNFGFHRFPRTFFYPGFYGGFGYDPFFYDSYPTPTSSYPYANAGYAGDYGYYPSAQQPQVVINQGYPQGYPVEPAPAPLVQEYAGPVPVPESRKYEQPLYLIAFKDGTLKAVLAYWVQGTALHYVTMDHEQKQSPLASIDRELSERFNRERNVSFQLPR